MSMRTLVSAAIVLSVVGVTGCASTAQSSEGIDPTDQRPIAPIVERAETFTSIDQLLGASDGAVIATWDGDIRENPAYGSADAPLAIVELDVESVEFGALPEDSVAVTVEAG